LYAGVRRIDIRTEIVNNDKLVRYQALFPTSITNGKYTQEIPFGAVERPIGVEYPAQNWADYSDAGRGVTVLNHGLPGNLVTGGTMLLSLLRSHTIGGYGFGGGFEPGMTSDSGYELNRKLTFDYAVVPHGAAWQDAATRAGFSFNQPLQVWKTDVHPGILPPSRSWLSISDPAIILTAFKLGAGGSVILRMYEAAGMPAKDVMVRVNSALLSARECNLMEDDGKLLPTVANSIKLDFKPYEIRTVKMQLAGAWGLARRRASTALGEE
jgi:alpha-mannosidase